MPIIFCRGGGHTQLKGHSNRLALIDHGINLERVNTSYDCMSSYLQLRYFLGCLRGGIRIAIFIWYFFDGILT